MRLKKLNLRIILRLINFLFYFFVISFLFLGNEIEFNIYNNASISPEFIISLILQLFLIILFIKKNKNFINSYHLLFFTFSLLFFIIFTKDFILFGFRSLYGINFIILLLSIFIFLKFINIENYIFINYLFFIFIIYLTFKFIFNPQIIEDYDYLDTSEGRVYRLKFFGFESNTIAIILNCIIIYLLYLNVIYFKNKNILKLIITNILIIFMLYFLFSTFSRASYLSLFFCIFYLIGFRNSIMIIAPLFFYIIYYLIKNNFINEFVIDRILEITTFNNPRIEMWLDGINYFKNGSVINYFFGIGFNKFALDNTILNIFLSTGIFGTLLFSIFFYNLYKFLTYKNKNKFINAIFINILFTSFFIDYFAQRKIIYIAFLIIVLILKRKNKIEYSNI